MNKKAPINASYRKVSYGNTLFPAAEYESTIIIENYSYITNTWLCYIPYVVKYWRGNILVNLVNGNQITKI